MPRSKVAPATSRDRVDRGSRTAQDCTGTKDGDMPPRDNPTARQARLGCELRKLREQAGRTAREAAGLISTDQSKISHMEAGRIGISEARIRRLASFYACDDAVLIEAL